ncbi:MAG: hypothetical protein F6K36_10605 [Symploca sp. SIO3C6]|nr:hypothetical protein [Symploca sp. SIO3C6]
MDDEELATLLRDLESDRVERKASISDRKVIRQAICAFANDLSNHQQPGILFIGVDDDGSCANLSITDQLLLTLSDMRSDGNILPFPSIVVQNKTIDGCELVVLIVEPSDAPPVRFNGRVWVRVGPRKATATREEERRLSEKRRAKDLPFDLQALVSATVDDFDLDMFRRTYLPSSLAIEIIEENQRPIEQQLTSMRFATVELPPKPTVLGILVFGNEPRQFIPGAYIQFLRIEIQNPGGPFGQVNKQNFGQPGVTDYRNPHLAEAMKNLGYVQRFGIGIQLARQQLQKNGNPSPELVVEDSHVLVTVRRNL